MKTEAIKRALAFWKDATRNARAHQFEWAKFFENCDEATAELAALEAELEAMKDEILCLKTDMPMADRLMNQRASIKKLQADNARKDVAIRQHLEWGPKTGSDRDLLDADLEAALSTTKTDKVLVSKEQLREIEWSHVYREVDEERHRDSTFHECPVCEFDRDDGRHMIGCWLGDALKEAEDA